jgi:hypothetical protein
MVTCKLGVNALIKLAIAGTSGVQGFEAAVVLGQFLFDDIRLDGDAEVISLPR